MFYVCEKRGHLLARVFRVPTSSESGRARHGVEDVTAKPMCSPLLEMIVKVAGKCRLVVARIF